MRIDLHCHTSQRSSDSLMSEEALIKKAIRLGLDGVAFTDHDTLPPPRRLLKLNEKYAPFRIFTGIEISLSTTVGWQDFLVIGLNDPILESNWTYPQLLNWVRAANGWIAWAHPFRLRDDWPREVKDNPPDALEIYSTNIKPHLSPRIELEAKALGCQIIGTSDAHMLQDVGCNTIVLDQVAASDAELVIQLKKGAFQVKKGI